MTEILDKPIQQSTFTNLESIRHSKDLKNGDLNLLKLICNKHKTFDEGRTSYFNVEETLVHIQSYMSRRMNSNLPKRLLQSVVKGTPFNVEESLIRLNNALSGCLQTNLIQKNSSIESEVDSGSEAEQ